MRVEDNPDAGHPVSFEGSRDPLEFSVRFGTKESGLSVTLGEVHAVSALLAHLLTVPKPRRLELVEHLRLMAEAKEG